MTVETFSKTAVATAVQADLEAKLAAVKVRIAEIEGQLPELRDAESWLERVLAAAGAGAVPSAAAAAVTQAAEAALVAEVVAVKVPRPRRARSAAAAAESVESVESAVEAEIAPAAPAVKSVGAGKAKPRAKAKPAAKARPAAKPAAKPTARRSAKKVAAKKSVEETAPVAKPSSTQRALAFLQETGGPQKAVEIAQHLFGAEPTQGNVNLVRSALETLVRRGAVTKAKQGTTAFYEAEHGAAATGGAAAVEAEAAVPSADEATAVAAEK